ncbi:MAG: hypothetical protein V1837_03560 [Candidatus Woesearchaeota archaeon]
MPGKSIVLIDGLDCYIESLSICIEDLGYVARPLILDLEKNVVGQARDFFTKLDRFSIEKVILSELRREYLPHINENATRQEVQAEICRYQSIEDANYGQTLSVLVWLKSNSFKDISMVLPSLQAAQHEILTLYRQHGASRILEKVADCDKTLAAILHGSPQFPS